MPQVKTNNTSLQVAVESTIGVLPGSPTWFLLEPNDITDFGATLTTTPREPISSNRQRSKGAITDLDSAVALDHDLTREVFDLFAPGFCFAQYQGPIIARPTSCDTNSYTVPAGPTLVASNLIYVRGFSTTANNGLKVVDTGATTTDIPVTTALTAEASPPTNALIEVAGYRFPTSDLAITVTSGVATIVSAAVNLTTIGISVGQLFHIGGLASGQQFSAGAGYGRVRSISTTTIVADKLSSTVATDPGTGDTVDLLFGSFVANVPVGDADFLERSYTFELAYPDLDTGPTDAYQYSVGNMANEVAVSLPLADKAGISFAFVGTDTQSPTTTRATNAASPIQPLQTSAYNTSADVLRLRIQDADENGLTTCFKDVTVTIGNAVSPEKCIGTLGATYVNQGLFTVDLEGEILFTSIEVAEAVRTNATVSLDLLVKNDDGAISIDVPSMTLGDGSPSFPVNESVRMSLSGSAFRDAFFGTSVGISTFPIVP